MDPDRPLLLVLHHCSGFAGERAISGLSEEKVSQGPIIGVTTVYRLRSDLRDYCALFDFTLSTHSKFVVQ
ncbi:hypothetical protein A9F13_12g00792 [Clavispora lusitaniae]|uniref:Uncharacterized protein n=1 Tax=Clavispora lusitaniae TaxID=36911 RepID=A0AA91PXS9_CLALS|nr:hypothetical protein A9F13_12g00792 [Clavispora lusitaniae]